MDADLRAGMQPGEAGKKYGLRPSSVYQHGRLHIESIESRGPDECTTPRQSTDERMVEPPAIDFSINGEDTPLPARRPVEPELLHIPLNQVLDLFGEPPDTWRQFCEGLTLMVKAIRKAHDGEPMQDRMRDRLQQQLMDAFARDEMEF